MTPPVRYVIDYINIDIYSTILFSDLEYLADVNAGIFKVMQTVDPDAVWYNSLINKNL